MFYAYDVGLPHTHTTYTQTCILTLQPYVPNYEHLRVYRLLLINIGFFLSRRFGHHEHPWDDLNC